MKLSASRIKTYLTCSWTYYCKYVLKLPDESNDGAKRGTVTHLILECLLNPRHQKYIKQCEKDPSKCKPINRLIIKTANGLGVGDEENIKLIYSFVKVGLKSDFFCDGYQLLEPEYKFDIQNEFPKYEILGFIDKSAVSDSEILVVDYKTSKAKFSGNDKDFNIQALTYALALHKRFPHLKEITVRFLFLKFPRSPEVVYKFDAPTLFGFEFYLEKFFSFLSKFDLKKACSNFAKNNENFWICGAKKGDVKADGTPKWICPLKYPFVYWEVRNGRGEIVKTSFEEPVLDKTTDDWYCIEQKLYCGCPAFAGKVGVLK